MHVDLRACHIYASCSCRVADLGREKAAAEERAAAAATEKEESLRAATEELQNALQKSEDLSEVSRDSRAELHYGPNCNSAWS